MNPLRVIPLFTALLLAIILGCAAKPQTYTGTVITERCGAGRMLMQEPPPAFLDGSTIHVISVSAPKS